MAPGTSPVTSKPSFPAYLLPSFKLPFRRRPTNTSLTSDVPSLSSSPSSSATTSPTGSPPSSLPTYFDAVSGDKRCPPPTVDTATSPSRRVSRTAADTLRCTTCSSDVAFLSQIVSKGFTGRYGRAYLVSPPCPPSPFAPEDDDLDLDSDRAAARDLMNIRTGRSENRQLVTGWHVVADINCAVCGVKLGWKYVDAREPSQKYKVGKFILETERVAGFRSWEDVDVDIDEDYGIGTPESSSKSSPPSPPLRRAGAGGEGADEEIIFDSEDEDECEDIFAGTWDPVVVAQRRTQKLSKGGK